MTVATWLERLAPERRAEIEPVLATVRRHMPKGYAETEAGGLVSWIVPLATYPDTYNGEPLAYACLAAQKKHNALYLMGPYSDENLRAQLETAFAEAGKTMDMGKSCLRFQRAEELPLDAVGKVIAALPPAAYIALHESARSARKR